MQIEFRTEEGVKPLLWIIAFYENADNKQGYKYNDIEISSKVFKAEKDSIYTTVAEDSVYIFVGLGVAPDYKSVRTAYRRAFSSNKSLFANGLAMVFPEGFSNDLASAAVNGIILGTYSNGHFKSDPDDNFLTDDFTLVISGSDELKESVKTALIIGRSQLEVLRLVDLPPNRATPELLSSWATAAGSEYGFKVTVLDRAESEAQGLHAFAAVGQGSSKEAQFIIAEYTPANTPTTISHIGLVGKGITFDTGGLNIKTSGMLHMKSDMAGGAAVLGTIRAVAALQLPVRVTAIIPCCENSVGSSSFLPGDVISSYSGKSIEIIDTDAEGRLILADGLSYLLSNFDPDIVIDIATLTGSAVSTFGYECAALFSTNEKLVSDLTEAGNRCGERVWTLPLWDDYSKDIESDIADVRNYSGKPIAGAITAAKFLEFFTKDHNSWAHLDIAGVAYGDDEFSKSKHATAYGVHLLTNFIANV